MCVIRYNYFEEDWNNYKMQVAKKHASKLLKASNQQVDWLVLFYSFAVWKHFFHSVAEFWYLYEFGSDRNKTLF